MSSKISRREFFRKASRAGLACASALGRGKTESFRPLWQSFVMPPEDSRIMMRWWWFGPAVTHQELEQEMRAMRNAEIGGFEIQPVYPLALDDPERGIRNLPYLSDRFLEALRFVNQKAQELAMRLDLTLGSGWPYGGAKVMASQAAGMLRVERVPILAGEDSVRLPGMEAGEEMLAAWAVRDDQKELAAENLEELTKLEGPRVSLQSVAGARLVMFFIASRTGMQVKRAAIGAEGFVIDHYDAAAVAAYLQSTGERLMQAFDSNKPYAIFSDSLEVEGSNWTPNLLAEFTKRRGYDLKPHLPALVADAGPETASVRCDWGRTLTELANENYLTRVREWADHHGTRFRSQNYGEPPVTLSSNRLVDLPEGENPNWRGFSPARWAASACHLYGKQVTSAETWTWVHSPAFRATPLDLEAEADHNFLQGVNQIVGHGWPYSPPAAGEPGWRFYAAGALNAHNPWWSVMPDLARYLHRVCFLLRQGKPANDVALYVSNSDAWACFRAGTSPSVSETLERLISPAVIEGILDAGFNFDFIDDEAIGQVGIPYRAIVLPAVERIPLSVYQRVEQFARRGGVVIATGRRPDLAPGLLEGKRDGAAVRALTHELFEASGAVAIFIRDNSALGSILSRKVVPDVALSPQTPEIGFIHRKLDAGEIYFLANTGNRRRLVDATFRVTNLAAECWDPFTARAFSLKARRSAGGRITIALSLAPYQSTIVVFSQSQSVVTVPSARAERKSPLMDLSRGWRVSFPELGRSFQMDKLRSWTEYPDLKFFSGRGIYEKAFSLPRGSRGRERLYLSFGEGRALNAASGQARGFRALIESPVREAAVVEVNGQHAGYVWRPPYELEVREYLRPGENTLRIEVGNLAINAMAGQSLPASRLLFDRYGRRATPQDMSNLEPLPSGLLGPIRMTAG